MKKKILTAVIIFVVMIIPSIVAIIAYTSARNNPVTRNSVTSISVKSPDGTIYYFSKEASSDESGTSDNGLAVFDCFFDMNSSSESVSSLPTSESEYQCFDVTYKSYNIVSEYKYYITRDPENSYYKDSKGGYHKISPDAVRGFLSTGYATCVFPSAAQPVLTVGSTKPVIPSKMEWKFLGYNETFFDGVVNTTDEIPTCDVTGGLQLSFDTEPDYIFAEIKDKNGNIVFDDSYDKIDQSLFTDNTVYDVTLTAKWYNVEDRSNYGEGVYKFTANVLSPAVFYLNTTKIEYGDFVVISAKNIVDKSLIGFISEPDISFTPTFFEHNGYYHALVPVSLDCIKKNNSASKYTLTLSYAGIEQELFLDVSVRKSAVGYPNVSLQKINECFSDSAKKSFSTAMAPHFANECNELYWMDDNMLVTPTTRNVKIGFGLEVILSANKSSYTHHGVDYKVLANDTVSACLPGIVTYVGETKLSGKIIVVDHGGGLKSTYSNLSSQGVEEGDVVSKGQIIGIVGNTGFCEGTSLHFGLYVFDVPVRYYSYETNGVFISDAIKK